MDAPRIHPPSETSTTPATEEREFDGSEWALKTCKAYPSWTNQDATQVPPSYGYLYQDTIDREAEAKGGKLAAAEWLLGLVQEYARQHPDPEDQYIMRIENFLRQGYNEVKMPAKRKVYVPAETDEECAVRVQRENRERRAREKAEGLW